VDNRLDVVARGVDVARTCRRAVTGIAVDGTMCEVGTHGWPHTFRPRPWDDIASFLGDMAERDVSFAYMAAVVDSVLESGAAQSLAGMTSMHDLVVTPTPVAQPPVDVVIVRAPSSLHSPSSGNVRIEQQSLTGHDDRIERPATEAVPLFWRFMIEKFGVHPA
jgi:hypothetical protein